MLTHGEFKVIFLNRSEKDLFSDIYFCLSSSYGFLFMKDLKRLSRYPKIEYDVDKSNLDTYSYDKTRPQQGITNRCHSVFFVVKISWYV